MVRRPTLASVLVVATSELSAAVKEIRGSIAGGPHGALMLISPSPLPEYNPIPPNHFPSSDRQVIRP
jgi:hypothetical protein